jgi:hypothetical protein
MRTDTWKSQYENAATASRYNQHSSPSQRPIILVYLRACTVPNKSDVRSKDSRQTCQAPDPEERFRAV